MPSGKFDERGQACSQIGGVQPEAGEAGCWWLVHLALLPPMPPVRTCRCFSLRRSSGWQSPTGLFRGKVLGYLAYIGIDVISCLSTEVSQRVIQTEVLEQLRHSEPSIAVGLRVHQSLYRRRDDLGGFLVGQPSQQLTLADRLADWVTNEPRPG